MTPKVESQATPEEETMEVSRSGYDLLNTPLLNKGTAFIEAERDAFGLYGLLPPTVATLEEQVSRRLAEYRAIQDDLDRYIFLRGLQDTNETLFYALLLANLEDMMPIVYTPTVGRGCQQFSRIFHKSRGLFLSIPYKDRIRRILARQQFDGVEAIVVTDGERILGLGDQGAGGMGISIGKLSLYTACAGLHPAKTLPVLLDVGTDNSERLADPIYVGWRHGRVRGAEYDAFIEEFVAAVAERWPHILLHWEDFATANANNLLARYRGRLCTFNDDIQGTAAVAVGTLLSAINVTGVPLSQQRIAVFGAGSAGSGISALILRAMMEDGLSEAEARQRFFLVDHEGLLVEGITGIRSFQAPFLRRPADLANWNLPNANRIGLAEVVSNARPTVLIGCSGQPGAFTRDIVTTMAAHAKRPVIFPLSNPTLLSEATPLDLLAWTEGRAVIGTGSPFPPVMREGKTFRIDQTNNAYVYPGIGLGALAVQARHISDGMFMAAAHALAAASPARRDPRANLLPPIGDSRAISLGVARAVAKQAQAEGLAASCDEVTLELRLRAKIWNPVYHPYRHVLPAH